MDKTLPADVLAGADSLGYVMRRCMKLMTHQAEKLFEGRDLTFAQWLALTFIDSGLSSSPGEIARDLSHNTGATTRMLDQLEARGLLERHRDPTDRRGVTLTITPAGHSIVRDYHQGLADLTDRILADFDPSEVQVLMFLLRRVMGALEAIDKS
jgi:DNA-binding MarR family transcriptional regulator